MKTLLTTLFLLCLSAPMQAQVTLRPLAPECEKAGACPLPYTHLSTQATDPFYRGGRLVDQDYPTWNEYGPAVTRYSDVRDCLVADERDKPIPNLFLMNWRRLNVGADSEVCAFRILASLGRAEGIVEWLAHHDFTIRGPHQEIPYKSTGPDQQKTFSIMGSWTTAQREVRRPSILYGWFGVNLVDDHWININFTESMSILSVTFGSGK